MVKVALAWALSVGMATAIAAQSDRRATDGGATHGGAAARNDDAARASDLRDVAAAILTPLLRGGSDFKLTIKGRTRREIDITAPRVEGQKQSASELHLVFQRFGRDGFVVAGQSPWADFELRRTAATTELYLPKHGVRFVGQGASGTDTLKPAGFARRLLGSASGALDIAAAMILFKAAALPPVEGKPGWFRIDDGVTVHRGAGKLPTLVIDARRELVAGLHHLEVSLDDDTGGDAPPVLATTTAKPDSRTIPLPRASLDRMIVRAMRRLVQTHAPLPALRAAAGIKSGKTAHGELRAVGDQRLVLLHGTPAQIGKAHGELLGDRVRQTVDSSLYLVGLIETVRQGKWFPDVLRDAWRRLSPHIPARHIEELDAVADAIPGLSREELRLANVFPEYFHCSGFAVFGSATKGGKLYHGRVLDYMTMIGLQHAAATFVVKPDHGYAFLNVGYAGFVGCVTGMNEQQISLGEMGGRGAFAWDGVPMATLMRRALEECASLDAVKNG